MGGRGGCERELVHPQMPAAANQIGLTNMCEQPVVYPQRRPMLPATQLGFYLYPTTLNHKAHERADV